MQGIADVSNLLTEAKKELESQSSPEDSPRKADKPLGATGGSVIGRLPKYVALPILIEWLELIEVCLLDASMSSRKERYPFLQLLSRGGQYVFDGAVHDRLNGPQYWRWLNARQVRVKRVSVYFEDYQQATGRNMPWSDYYWSWSIDEVQAPSVAELASYSWGQVSKFAYENTLRPFARHWVKPIIALPDSLTSLTITALRDEHAEFFDTFTAGSLRTLSMAHCFIETTFNVRVFQELLIRHAPTLTDLSLHSCGVLSARAFPYILARCTVLRKLSLIEGKDTYRLAKTLVATDAAAIKELTINCFGLTDLTLAGFVADTDDLAIRLLNHCTFRHLQLLRGQYTSATLLHIAKENPDIVSLAIDAYTEQPESGALTAVATACQRLEYLNLSPGKGSHWPVDGFEKIIQGCASLRYLHCSVPAEALSIAKPEGLTMEPVSVYLTGWTPAYPDRV